MSATTNTGINFPGQSFELSSSSPFRALTYSKCEHAWSYLGKVSLLTRNMLNTAARNHYVMASTGKGFPDTLKEAAIKMKLLSIFGVPFSLVDLSSIIAKSLNSLSLKDWEGTAFGALSLTITTAEIVDSLTTFINASLTVSSLKPIEAFSTLGLPLGFTMSSLGTISRTIQIGKSLNLFRNINLKVNQEVNFDRAELQSFLERILMIDKELKTLLRIPQDELTGIDQNTIKNLKEKNKASLLRAVSQDAVKELEALLVLLEANPQSPISLDQQVRITRTFKEIQFYLSKKMQVDALAILANLITLSALNLFRLGSSTASPFALLSLAFSVRLAALYYNEQKTRIPNIN
ncbi:MAG: hypothetical protein H0V82_06510 [Candidatus Protochlamydia sp.]|nr:hypothetical protein [Candidatus Protochlamydia sp.]